MSTSIWFNKTFSHIRSAMALIRAADDANAFKLYCSSVNPHFVGFLEADVTSLEPRSVTGQAYIDFCLEFCRTNSIRLVYPGKEAAMVGQHADDFAALGTTVISVAKPQTLDLLHNKALFYDKYHSATVPTPDFAVVDSFDSFVTAYDLLRERHSVLAIKPAISVYGIGFRIIDEQRPALTHMLGGIDYHVALSDLRRELEQAGQFKPLLLMEFLSGHEYSVDCLASHGRLRCAIPRRKGADGRSGQVIELRDDILAACATLAKEEGLNAIFNAQFRVAANGSIKLLEINPRMAGGIAMSCLAGPNLPYLAMLDALNGITDEQIPPVKTGTRVGEVPLAVIYP